MKFDVAVRDLTKREDEVCDNICKGMGNIAIGKQMGITTGTVQKHVYHILSKLNVDSRLKVAVMITRRRMQCKSIDSPIMLLGDSKNDLIVVSKMD